MSVKSKQQVRSSKRAQTRRLWTTLYVVMLCLAIFTNQISALVAIDLDPTEGEGIVPVICDDANPALTTGGIRISNPSMGETTYEYGDSGVTTNPGEGFVPDDFEITVTVRDTDNGPVFDFESNYPICEVVAKGGNQGALCYDYRPDGTLSDEGLHAPNNVNEQQGTVGKYAGLSHIDFYLCEDGGQEPGDAEPEIDVKKYVSIDGGDTWLDANAKPYPVLDEKLCIDPQYKIVVTNTGNVTLTDIELEDTLYQSLVDEKDIPETLAPEATFTIKFTAPWQAGEVCNEVTAYGTYEGNTVDDSDTACYVGKTFEACPEIDVEKLVSVDGGTTWHDADKKPGPTAIEGDCKDVMFKFIVENTGNVKLTDIKLTDNKYNDALKEALKGVDLSCLEPGQKIEVCITVPFEAGEHCNTATVCADYCGKPVEDSDDANYCGIEACPEIDIEKLVSVDGGKTWHDADHEPGPMMYQGMGKPMFKFVVKNTGNVKLTDIKLKDSDYQALVDAEDVPGWLAAGDEFCVIIEAPFRMGLNKNVAEVCAEFCGEEVKDSDKAYYCGVALPCPEIDVEKLVSVDGGTTWHDADKKPGPTAMEGECTDIMFKFIVKNTGNVKLTDIKLTDNKYNDELCEALEGVDLSCLEPGDTFEVCITVPFETGEHCNTATVCASFYGKTVEDCDDANYCGIEACPEIMLEKSISVDGGKTWHDADEKPGPELPFGILPKFKFYVKNTGNVDLTDIKLKDSDYQYLIDKHEIPAKLCPGEDFCIEITTLWLPGNQMNVAEVCAEYCGEEVKDIDKAYYNGTITLPCPEIDVEKLVSVDGGTTWHDADEKPGPMAIEDECKDVMFKFIVKNTGNVKLTDIKLTDNKYNDELKEALKGVDLSCLEPGDTFEVCITVPFEAGEHCNTATVCASFYGKTVEDCDDANYCGVEVNPAIDVTKMVANEADGVFGDLAELMTGEKAIYKVVVKNTGDVKLEDVYLTDDQVMEGTMATIMGVGTKAFEMKDGKAVLMLGSLEPGASLTITYLWQADLADAGDTIENTAKAVGSFGKKHVSDSDSATVIVNEIPLAVSGIKLEKWVENVTAGSGKDDKASGFVGDIFRYTVKIMNTGDTALMNVTLHDSHAKVGTEVWIAGDPVAKMWADDGSGHAKLVIGNLAAGESMTFTYAYKALAADEGEDLVNLAHVMAEYEGMPLESSDTATICVQENPPQTGESENNSMAGIALLFSGLAALIIRRKFAFLR